MIKPIWGFYKYIFYREYLWYKKKFGEGEFPHYSAIFGMSLSLISIILSLLILPSIIFKSVKIPYSVTNKSFVLLFSLGILIIHYFIFLKNKKYLLIENEFRKESRKEKYKKGWLVISYSVGSILLFISILFIGIYFRKV